MEDVDIFSYYEQLTQTHIHVTFNDKEKFNCISKTYDKDRITIFENFRRQKSTVRIYENRYIISSLNYRLGKKHNDIVQKLIYYYMSKNR